jgi:hypothetical protein
MDGNEIGYNTHYWFTIHRFYFVHREVQFQKLKNIAGTSIYSTNRVGTRSKPCITDPWLETDQPLLTHTPSNIPKVRVRI